LTIESPSTIVVFCLGFFLLLSIHRSCTGHRMLYRMICRLRGFTADTSFPVRIVISFSSGTCWGLEKDDELSNVRWGPVTDGSRLGWGVLLIKHETFPSLINLFSSNFLASGGSKNKFSVTFDNC
jgi:hypothetical protein